MIYTVSTAPGHFCAATTAAAAAAVDARALRPCENVASWIKSFELSRRSTPAYLFSTSVRGPFFRGDILYFFL